MKVTRIVCFEEQFCVVELRFSYAVNMLSKRANPCIVAVGHQMFRQSDFGLKTMENFTFGKYWKLLSHRSLLCHVFVCKINILRLILSHFKVFQWIVFIRKQWSGLTGGVVMTFSVPLTQETHIYHVY